MAAAKGRKSLADDFENSILSRLIQERQQNSAEEEFANDVTILFCGAKKSGKTSLVDRFITKDEKDNPKPTVALDYKFARYAAEASNSKVLAHIYDLGGDESNEGLVTIPVSPGTIGNIVLAITLDLSAPHSVLRDLEKWVALLSEQVRKAFLALQQEPNGAKRIEAIQNSRTELYAENPDASAVRLFPVPLVIFGTKWDAMAEAVDPDKRKLLCRALRHFAHVNGASLIMTSTKDKTSLNAYKGILRQLLFGVTAKGGLPQQLDPSKPLCVLAGKDGLQAIGAPTSSGGMSTDGGWKSLMGDYFPDPQLRSKDPKKSESAQVGEELKDPKFAESSIDGMVEQRLEELQQYRRQVERNQRLASEGVDARKEISAN